MVEEHLSTIRSEEEAAKRRIREAEGEAAAIVDAAREEGERRLEQVRAEAAEHERALLDEARAQAEEKITAMRAESGRVLSTLEGIAKKNEERALGIIVDSFKKTE